MPTTRNPMFADAPEAYRDRPPRFPEATSLVSVGLDCHGREAMMFPAAASAWRQMAEAASREGHDLRLVSAYRSIARQAEIIRRKREKGLSWDEILKVSAYPGFSEHHTGCAVDIASPFCPPLTEDFEQTPEFAWLAQHAATFRFHLSFPRGNPLGVSFEPWHWCWHAAPPPSTRSAGCSRAGIRSRAS
jgi:D-alanyl-D-alanine carboxypeptidase